MVALVVAAVMWLASALLPVFVVPLPVRVGLAAAVAAAGVGVVAAAKTMLRRARTTENPTRPGRATYLVTGGVYRFSRNPLYLGMALILLAWAVYLASPFAVVLCAVFVLYLSRFQIQPEERALSALFGPEYGEYLRQVRRWL